MRSGKSNNKALQRPIWHDNSDVVFINNYSQKYIYECRSKMDLKLSTYNYIFRIICITIPTVIFFGSQYILTEAIPSPDS